MARDRTIYNDFHSDVSNPIRPRRIEVLSGVERRRKWSDKAKMAIVAETLAEGVAVADIARRHDINPSQLFGWVKQLRTHVLAKLDVSAAPEPSRFATAIVGMAPQPVAQPIMAAASEPASIEISVGGVRVQIRGAADAKTLALVLRALKVLA